MDPRTASKVTSPDLTKAFNMGRGFKGGEEEPSSSVWVVFTVGDDVKRAVQYPLMQLDVALADVRVWLRDTLEGGAILLTSVKAPGIYEDAQLYISAAEH